MTSIGCGGMILKGNKVLLMLRTNASTYNEMWSNPGGSVEPDEEIEDAVIREISEELGVTVEIIKHLGDYEEIKEGKVKSIASGYEVTIVKGIPQIMEPHKAKELRYFQIDNLPENLAPYTKLYLEKLKLSHHNN